MVQRWTAYKTTILEILNATAHAGEQQEFIDSQKRLLQRVNVIASIIDRVDTPSFITLIIDDGTGTISLRCFEIDKVPAIDIGGCVMCIARIREFNNERHLVAEIIKPVQPQWALLRRIELGKVPPMAVQPTTHSTTETAHEEAVDSLYITVLEAVVSCDHGPGADFKEILTKVQNPSAEKALQRLLELGEIFEVKPGKFKVL